MSTNQGTERAEPLPGEREIPTVTASKRASPVKVIVIGAVILSALLLAIWWSRLMKHKETEDAAPSKKAMQTSALPAKTFFLPPEKPTDAPAAPAPDAQKALADAGGVPRPQAPPGAPGAPGTAQGAPQPPKPAAFSRASGGAGAAASGGAGAWIVSHAVLQETTADDGGLAAAKAATPDGNSQSKLSSMLVSSAKPPKSASLLRDQDYLIPRGASIDCVLTRRLDSTVPGMTSCMVTQNVYGSTGKVLLIERGSTVDGEYGLAGGLQQGQKRIFVLWSRIRTPSGVVIDLDSPATDSLGGAGLPGYVDNHFWQRFGGAMLLSVVQDVVQAAVTRNQDGSTINLGNTSDATQTMAAEALRATINIPPTLYKNQGERASMFVARDLNFRSVYELTSD